MENNSSECYFKSSRSDLSLSTEEPALIVDNIQINGDIKSKHIKKLEERIEILEGKIAQLEKTVEENALAIFYQPQGPAAQKAKVEFEKRSKKIDS